MIEIVLNKEEGKTNYAKKTSLYYENPVWIHNTDLDSPFLFQSCTEDTDLIIFEDVKIKYLLRLLNVIGKDEILIQKPLHEEFKIRVPDVMIIIDNFNTN